MNNFKPENELNLNEYPFDDTIVEEKNEQISNEYFLGNIIIAKSEEKQEKQKLQMDNKINYSSFIDKSIVYFK